jgi:hypothetical protein
VLDTVYGLEVMRKGPFWLTPDGTPTPEAKRALITGTAQITRNGGHLPGTVKVPPREDVDPMLCSYADGIERLLNSSNLMVDVFGRAWTSLALEVDRPHYSMRWLVKFAISCRKSAEGRFTSGGFFR